MSSVRRHAHNQTEAHSLYPAALTRIITLLAKLIIDIKEHGKQQGGLYRVRVSALKELGRLVDELDVFHGMDVAGAIGEETWYGVADLHNSSLVELNELSSSNEHSHTQRLEGLVSSILFLFIKANVFKAEGMFGSRFAYVLIHQYTFHQYARLLAAWSQVQPNVLEPKLRLMAQFSLIFSSCAQLTVNDRPLTSTDHDGTALYAAFLDALHSSNVLEHISKALLGGLKAASEAVTDRKLSQEQYGNIRIGVMETCGCIASALHGIAGKQGMLDSCWAAAEGDGLMAPEGGSIAEQLLLKVRAVLSGPCLQFLLAREIIASRLRLTNGVGLDYKLPRFMLPEVPEVGDLVQHAPARALADRLLSRLGAAALVFHLIIPGTRRNGAPARTAAAAAVALALAAPTMPFKPVNVFDMMLDALSAVIDRSIDVDRLPGGSQLTLVEPAMLLVRLRLRLSPQHALERLRKLWDILTKLMRRPNVQLQYSEHRPLQLIGGLLRLDLQRGAGGGAGADTPGSASGVDNAAGTSANGCAFNLRCALDAGFVPAVEKLLRGWGRAVDPDNKGETSCLRAVNHLVRWPFVWTSLLAHGSVGEVASLIITLRRLGEVFKDRGFEVMFESGSNEPNEHQDAEVVVTAYMAALLEQQAVALIPSRGSTSLPLNESLESDGLSMDGRTAIQILKRGVPAVGTPADVQQRALAIFALSQWLPNSVWLARVVDTWFSVHMAKAVLRWVLQISLQCLVARFRSDAECAAAVAQLGASSAGTASGSEQRAAAVGFEGSSPAAEQGSSSSASTSSSASPAVHRSCGPGTVAYMAWVTFLMVSVDMLAWINKYFDQLKELDGEEAAAGRKDPKEATGRGLRRAAALPSGGSGQVSGEAAEGDSGEGVAGLAPRELEADVLDILEVLALAMPSSVQACVSKADSSQRPATAAGAEIHSEGNKTAGYIHASAAGVESFGAAAVAAAHSAVTAAGIPPKKAVDAELVTAREGQQGSSLVNEVKAGADVRAPAAPASSVADAAEPSQQGSASDGVDEKTARSKLERGILLDDWLRNLLNKHERKELLSVLNCWAEGNCRSASSSSRVAEVVTQQPVITPEEQTPQLLGLQELVYERHEVAHLPALPSPYGAAELVEAAGIKLCANPGCMNLDKDTEAALSGTKICPRCKAATYCSSNCQWTHWKSQHHAECPGAARPQ